MADLVELRDRVRGIFRQNLHIDPLTDETDLVEAGLLDSLVFVDLLFNLEQVAGVRITLDTLDIEKLKSVAGIAEFVAGLDGLGSR